MTAKGSLHETISARSEETAADGADTQADMPTRSTVSPSRTAHAARNSPRCSVTSDVSGEYFVSAIVKNLTAVECRTAKGAPNTTGSCGNETSTSDSDAKYHEQNHAHTCSHKPSTSPGRPRKEIHVNRDEQQEGTCRKRKAEQAGSENIVENVHMATQLLGSWQSSEKEELHKLHCLLSPIRRGLEKVSLQVVSARHADEIQQLQAAETALVTEYMQTMTKIRADKDAMQDTMVLLEKQLEDTYEMHRTAAEVDADVLSCWQTHVQLLKLKQEIEEFLAVSAVAAAKNN